jgi:ATP-dependent Clp protease ATP-binding subunit ClpC
MCPDNPQEPVPPPSNLEDILARVDALAHPKRPVAAAEVNPPQPGGGAPSPSALAAFGTDLTAQARDSGLAFHGREEEIETVLEALCRRRKANPLLLGPPGSGKTALVEAVASRIANGPVPDVLRDQRVISISTGALVAGGGMVGEVEARIEALLREARGTDVILFFDEVHTLMGAGGKEGTGDVASLIKPALARGEIRCIAATTDDEFHRFIRSDAALERRFLPIRLRELTAAETRRVLAILRDSDTTAPTIPDQVLDAIVEIMQRVLPNRHFPDKAIDLFDQVVAHARLRDAASVSVAMVEMVAERMAGIPASPSTRLATLADGLRRRQWCSEEDIEALTERLSITLRGLDIQTDRPNLVAAIHAQDLSRIRAFAGHVAEALYGDAKRVIEIDGGTFGSDASITTLIGASAGYVGYGDRHLLSALGEQPCHIVLVHGMESASDVVRDLIAQGITSGWVTDARKRHIPFSETVVLAWEPARAQERPVIGFASRAEQTPPSGDRSDWRFDVTITLQAGDHSMGILDLLAKRWAESEGISLSWTQELRDWVAGAGNTAEETAAFVDQRVVAPLWRLLRGTDAMSGSRFVIGVEGDTITARPEEAVRDRHV